jgi:hypothetical protein
MPNIRKEMGHAPHICGSSSIWLERFPVTEEVAGSSPVSRADEKAPHGAFSYAWV